MKTPKTMMKRIIATETLSTLAQLKTTIQRLAAIYPADTVNAENATGDVVTLDLIEETLTDGSKVYNLRIS
jgi:hypothetical protein